MLRLRRCGLLFVLLSRWRLRRCGRLLSKRTRVAPRLPRVLRSPEAVERGRLLHRDELRGREWLAREAAISRKTLRRKACVVLEPLHVVGECVRVRLSLELLWREPRWRLEPSRRRRRESGLLLVLTLGERCLRLALRAGELSVQRRCLREPEEAADPSERPVACDRAARGDTRDGSGSRPRTRCTLLARSLPGRLLCILWRVVVEHGAAAERRRSRKSESDPGEHMDLCEAQGD